MLFAIVRRSSCVHNYSPRTVVQVTSAYLSLTLMQTNWHSPCCLAAATKKAACITLIIQHMSFVSRFSIRRNKN